MKTYAEKLKDPRWQRKRLEIMERDGFACRNCGSAEKTLHVHHIRYLSGREPWDYKNFYLVTLCEDCHIAEELEIKIKRERKGRFVSSAQKGFVEPIDNQGGDEAATDEEMEAFFANLREQLSTMSGGKS